MRLRPGQLAYLLMVQLRIVATSSEELVVVRPVFDEEEGAHEQSLLEGGSWSRPSCKVWGDPHIEPFIGNYFDIQLPTSAAPTIPNGPDDKPYTLISSWTPGKWQTKIQVRAWPIAGIWSVRPDGVPCIRDACAPVARFPQILAAGQHATNSMHRRDTKPQQYNIQLTTTTAVTVCRLRSGIADRRTPAMASLILYTASPR